MCRSKSDGQCRCPSDAPENRSKRRKALAAVAAGEGKQLGAGGDSPSELQQQLLTLATAVATAEMAARQDEHYRECERLEEEISHVTEDDGIAVLRPLLKQQAALEEQWYASAAYQQWQQLLAQQQELQQRQLEEKVKAAAGLGESLVATWQPEKLKEVAEAISTLSPTDEQKVLLEVLGGKEAAVRVLGTAMGNEADRRVGITAEQLQQQEAEAVATTQAEEKRLEKEKNAFYTKSGRKRRGLQPRR